MKILYDKKKAIQEKARNDTDNPLRTIRESVKAFLLNGIGQRYTTAKLQRYPITVQYHLIAERESIINSWVVKCDLSDKADLLLEIKRRGHTFIRRIEIPTLQVELRSDISEAILNLDAAILYQNAPYLNETYIHKK